MKVLVHKNLHKNMWSVRNKKTRLVISHEDKVYLKDCKFIVQKAGREKVRRDKKKNVHAFIEGELISKEEAYTLMSVESFPKAVMYDPYIHDTFMSCSLKSGLEPILTAPLVFLEDVVMAIDVD